MQVVAHGCARHSVTVIHCYLELMTWHFLEAQVMTITSESGVCHSSEARSNSRLTPAQGECLELGWRSTNLRYKVATCTCAIYNVYIFTTCCIYRASGPLPRPLVLVSLKTWSVAWYMSYLYVLSSTHYFLSNRCFAVLATELFQLMMKCLMTRSLALYRM